MKATTAVTLAATTLLCACAGNHRQPPAAHGAVPPASQPAPVVSGHHRATQADRPYAASLGDAPLRAARAYYEARGFDWYPQISVYAARPHGEVVLLWMAAVKRYPRHLVYDPAAGRVTGEFSGSMEGDETASPRPGAVPHP